MSEIHRQLETSLRRISLPAARGSNISAGIMVLCGVDRTTNCVDYENLPQIIIATSLTLAISSLAEPAAKPANDHVASVTGLKFDAYDGDPTNPKTMAFSVTVLGLQQPPNFLKIGQIIPNTNYQLTAFTPKRQKNPDTDREDEVSELMLTDVETKRTLSLTFGRAILIPRNPKPPLPENK